MICKKECTYQIFRILNSELVKYLYIYSMDSETILETMQKSDRYKKAYILLTLYAKEIDAMNYRYILIEKLDIQLNNIRRQLEILQSEDCINKKRKMSEKIYPKKYIRNL